jgi:deoxycytidine triphosphate deaminase
MTSRREEYLWKDPFESSTSGAVLLSDQIEFLAEEVGLIDPFDEKYLRPAAYDMRVGSCYYANDQRKDLTDEAIEIPANGLVYIRTKEKFNIPYYLVARYSLRVHHVYRGLMIDNGLHVDPGYSGYIWIPVHNFTTQARILPQGLEFISVEFNRTTPLPARVDSIGSQDELVSLGIKNQLKGSKGRVVKIFYKDFDRYKKRHEDFSPRLFWDKFPGETHQSAMLATDQRLNDIKGHVEGTVENFKKTVDRRFNIGWLGAFGLIIAVLGILLPILYAEYGKTRETDAQQNIDIKELRDRVLIEQNDINSLRRNQQTGVQQPGAEKAGKRSAK